MKFLAKINTKAVLAKVDRVIRTIVLLVSVLVIGAIVVDYGFVLDAVEMGLIHRFYAIGWWAYLISFSFQLVRHWTQIHKKAFSLTTLLGLLLYTSALPKLFVAADAGTFWGQMLAFLSNKYFVVGLLGIFALIEFSRGVSHFVNRRTNPALLVVLCFACVIVFGALLLMLPRSTMEHIRIPMIDALFVSTSAVCVTGLSTVEVAHTFTLEGQIIIALLIQIGGLGIMTITTFFAIFFMDGLGLYSQFTLKEMLSSNASSLMSTLLNVLGFTLIIELVGAFFIWLSVHPMTGMALNQEIFFSIFHSVSAFCNAGFSTLEGNLGNEAVMGGNPLFFVVISLLVILGGVGFPILINMKRQFSYYLSVLFSKIFRKGKPYVRYSHLTHVNTKIVLWTTLILLSFGTCVIALCEWNGAFAGMSSGEKMIHAFFNSTVPRTAGFNSVVVSDFSRLTIVLYLLLMWIGGGSQSTAGGIKVNTVAVAFAAVKSLIKGQRDTVLFNREIGENSIRRALVVIFGSVFIIACFFIALLILEPTMSARDILFETVSAFSTVGSSLGVTPHFCTLSKFLLVLLMFIGRVGFITVLMSIISRKEQNKYRLPKESIIIN